MSFVYPRYISFAHLFLHERRVILYVTFLFFKGAGVLDGVDSRLMLSLFIEEVLSKRIYF